jgi:ATP-dependent Clp protease protease subunit
MQNMKSPVSTVSIGFTGSMGTALLTSGAKGRRYALPNATIHMHPTGGGAKGYTEDVRIAYQEQERLQEQLFRLIGRHSGHTSEEIETFFLRDRFLNALEAKEYGIIDEVLGNTEGLVSLSDIQTRIGSGRMAVAASK